MLNFKWKPIVVDLHTSLFQINICKNLIWEFILWFENKVKVPDTLYMDYALDFV